MLKLTGIGGNPCTGKTALMRGVIKELGKGVLCKAGILVYQRHDSAKTIVLGSYAKKGFGGTDRLSMAVQPIALGIIEAWASDPSMKDWCVIYEGDRLFNSSFINTVEKCPIIGSNWVILEASEEAQSKRHIDRKDTQSAAWLKGRVTKVLKLKESIKGVKVLNNETNEDLTSNIKYILKMMRSS